MKISRDQRGASHLIALLAVAVIVAVGLVGYRVMHNDSDQTASVSSQANVPAQIKSKADITQANKALDNTAIDSSVNPGQLDTEINSLL